MKQPGAWRPAMLPVLPLADSAIPIVVCRNFHHGRPALRPGQCTSGSASQKIEGLHATSAELCRDISIWRD